MYTSGLAVHGKKAMHYCNKGSTLSIICKYSKVLPSPYCMGVTKVIDMQEGQGIMVNNEDIEFKVDEMVDEYKFDKDLI